MILNKDIKAFMMHVTFLLKISIYSVKETQIPSLIAEEAKILTKYLHFLDIFSEKKALILSEITNLN